VNYVTLTYNCVTLIGINRSNFAPGKLFHNLKPILMKPKKLLTTLAILGLILIAGCKKDTFVETPGVCPLVVSTDPANLATGVPLNKTITATFNEQMNPATITQASFTVTGAAAVAGTVSYTGLTASFVPSSPLAPFTTYTGTITKAVKDLMRQSLQADYVWTFTTIPQLTLSSNPVAGGTTGGAGTFVQGSLVTVTAAANTANTFTNWTVNGIVVSTSSSYQFTMNGNKALVANFTPVTAGNFAVVLSSNPAAGGINTGQGSFSTGTNVNVVAFPNPLYSFVNWTENGVIVSTSSNYPFILSGNRTLVANYSLIPAGNFAVILSSNPAAGGTTSGSGSYSAGTSVTVSATLNPGYAFVNWTENFAIASTNLSYTFPINANKTLVANFAIKAYNLTVVANNGTVVKNPLLGPYNHGVTVTLAATANSGYSFTSWSGDATGTTNPLSVLMNADKVITANFTLVSASCPTIVDLGTSGNYAILTKAGISTTGVTSVTGNMGVSPAAATYITGFALILPAGGAFSTSSLVTGNIYAPGYANPTPADLTTAVSNMETAYTTANGLVVPAPVTELLAGNLNGQTLTKGIYKWGTGLSITSGITLDGGGDPCATWIFQIAGDLTVANGAIISLTNGASAKNVFWVVAGSKAALGTTVDFSGNILCRTLISLNTGARVTGRLLAQTEVTLNASTVVKP
jgi:hypothetical protein